MLRLHADHYFHIGGDHIRQGKPCQDYAISGDINEEAAFAVVSDGCSTGRHTDVGARIVALGAATAIKDYWIATHDASSETALRLLSLDQRIVSAGARDILGLAGDDMLATCMYAYLSPQGGFVHMQGDGVIALKYRDGRIAMSRYDWAQNTPFYPLYSSFPDTYLANFITAHKDDPDGFSFYAEKYIQEIDGAFTPVGISEFSCREGMRGITVDISKESLHTELAFVAVFSDGITQIDNVDWKDAVVKFMSFKKGTKNFAKRRMVCGIRETQKIGKGPFDDVAYAVIRVSNSEPEEE